MHRSLLVAMLALTAIGGRAKPKAEEAGAPAGAGSQGQATARIRTGVAPMLVADSAGIRHYLETVDTWESRRPGRSWPGR